MSILALTYDDVMLNYRTSNFEASNSLAGAFSAETAEECARLLADLANQFHAFEEVMLRALRGEWPSVVVLVNSWHRLIGDVLEAASGQFPDLVQKSNDQFSIMTASSVLSAEPIGYLNRLISEVPFLPLVSRFGRNIGASVVAINAVRLLLPGCPPLRIDVSPGWPDLPEGSDIDRYRRLVDLALRSMQPPLSRLKDLFNLNTGECAELFNVTRQAVEQWETNGDVPTARREKLANLLSIGELMERKLSPGRLPLVARRRADVYGGLTMLEMVRADRDDELRKLTEQAFDWSGAA